ncbi:phage tail protein, partial [Escherichia coli]|nr:phage tail protein [Escherichia coli]
PVPPLENLTLRQRITDKYLANLVTSVNSNYKEPDRWQCRANSS